MANAVASVPRRRKFSGSMAMAGKPDSRGGYLKFRSMNAVSGLRFA